MLTPEYLLRVAEGAEEIASELHNDIIKHLVASIMLRLGRGDDYLLTAKDKWMIEVLRDAGFLMEDIQREIARRTGQQLKEIRAAFEDAGVESLSWDDAIYEAAGIPAPPLRQSPALVRLLQRGYEATVGEWRNYTRSTADAAQQLFIRQCDRAYTLVSSGALSYTQAVREAVEAVAREGVTVEYPSGHRDTIETATLRAVRTGVSQACAAVTDARMEELDWDIILVSAHLGARTGDGGDNFTNHYWWQGKFYSRTGADKRFPPFSVCGMGDVQGIHGANCRHSHGPGDGENNPFEHYDSEENRQAYELSQRQRELERRIRKTKREVMALKEAMDDAEDPEVKAAFEADYRKKAALLQKQNKEYNDFCEENGLKRLQDRLHTAGWNRSQAAKASAAARRWKRSGASNEPEKPGSTDLRNVSGERSMALGMRQPPSRILSDEEILSIKKDADALNIPEKMLRFNIGGRTGYNESEGLINIRGDILPDLTSRIARDRMSSRAALAHEYYGHHNNSPSEYEIGDWRDEFRASREAALHAPNLTDEDRGYLIIDAYDRAREAGITLTYDKEAKQILYGYETDE